MIYLYHIQYIDEGLATAVEDFYFASDKKRKTYQGLSWSKKSENWTYKYLEAAKVSASLARGDIENIELLSVGGDGGRNKWFPHSVDYDSWKIKGMPPYRGNNGDEIDNYIQNELTPVILKNISPGAYNWLASNEKGSIRNLIVNDRFVFSRKAQQAAPPDSPTPPIGRPGSLVVTPPSSPLLTPAAQTISSPSSPKTPAAAPPSGMPGNFGQEPSPPVIPPSTTLSPPPGSGMDPPPTKPPGSPLPPITAGAGSSSDPPSAAAAIATEEGGLEEEYTTHPSYIQKTGMIEKEVDTEVPHDRAPGGLPSMILGTACKGDTKAPGCYSMAGVTNVRCDRTNARSAMCNFKTIAVPSEKDESVNTKYAVYNALDEGAKIKLQLQRAIIRYGFAAAVLPLYSKRVLDRNFNAVTTEGLFLNPANTRLLTSQPIFVSNSVIAAQFNNPRVLPNIMEQFLQLNCSIPEIDQTGRLGNDHQRLLASLLGAELNLENLWGERFIVSPHYSRFVPESDIVDLALDKQLREPHLYVSRVSDHREGVTLTSDGSDGQRHINIFYRHPGATYYVPYPIHALTPDGGSDIPNGAYINQVPERGEEVILNRASGMLKAAAQHLQMALSLFNTMKSKEKGSEDLANGVPRGAAAFLTRADINALKALSILGGPTITELPLTDLDIWRVTPDQKQLKVRWGTREISGALKLRVVFTEVLWSYWYENNSIGKLRRRVEFKTKVDDPRTAVETISETTAQARKQLSVRLWYMPQQDFFNSKYMVAEFY
jgi:hypothetical protein